MSQMLNAIRHKSHAYPWNINMDRYNNKSFAPVSLKKITHILKQLNIIFFIINLSKGLIWSQAYPYQMLSPTHMSRRLFWIQSARVVALFSPTRMCLVVWYSQIGCDYPWICSVGLDGSLRQANREYTSRCWIYWIKKNMAD